LLSDDAAGCPVGVEIPEPPGVRGSDEEKSVTCEWA
jgi:hypothetical protein